ncbi:uncharacterized protein N7482_004932 [Penicillium canariense]|uniref:Uncharacterized protein n=1 Tax=Penicillium canariense TaxID=189055 RepID=A0A9W9LMI8_9EURO|nr:uncharacterized protein N7482_004932 [Penicillium canariense]KAJ5166151.1 hypothetical protein N7482_004932 [Penicillium canariense]
MIHLSKYTLSFETMTDSSGTVLDTFLPNINVIEKTGHIARNESPGDDTYTVFLNDQRIALCNLTSYRIGDPSLYIPVGASKAFAFGPWKDRAANMRNVNRYPPGAEVYSSPMTSQDGLVESVALPTSLPG